MVDEGYDRRGERVACCTSSVPRDTYLPLIADLGRTLPRSCRRSDGGPSSVTAQVTGSNKGIGAEVARQLAHQGLTPVVTGRNEASAKKSAAAISADVGRDVPYHQARAVWPSECLIYDTLVA